MITINNEKKLCLICMEEHEVKTVVLQDSEEYKGEDVTFDATYEYCVHVDEFLETEEMIKANSLAMKDAYRKNVGLLTSNEIIEIRDKFKVSQKDFSEILDWGRATITRYENTQVQDRAHDDILRKIASDPEWLLQMLNRAKGKISEKAFDRTYKAAIEQYRNTKYQYLIDKMKVVQMYDAEHDENLSVHKLSIGNTTNKLIKFAAINGISKIDKTEDYSNFKWHKGENIKSNYCIRSTINFKESKYEYKINDLALLKL